MKYLLSVVFFAGTVASASACGAWGQPPCGPTTITTMPGGTTFIQRPMQPPTTMQTIGNSTFINTPGQRPRTCNTIGNSTFCN